MSAGIVSKRQLDGEMNEIDQSLGLAARALQVHARRTELLANNLANADTPNYHARDIDFRAALREAATPVPAPSLHTTAANHLQAAAHQDVGQYIRYRVQAQNSLDGNSVDTATEQAQFAANAVRYQAALGFVDGRVKSIMSAIRGE